MKKNDAQKILASIGTHPGQHWDFHYFKCKEILHYIYDRLIDVGFCLHPERKAIAIENLETNFGQHWESFWIGYGSFSIPKAKRFNSISEMNGLMYDLICTLSVMLMLKRVLNPILASIGNSPGWYWDLLEFQKQRNLLAFLQQMH